MTIDLSTVTKVSPGQSSPKRRPEILRHVTDLFIVGAPNMSDNEIFLFDDVLTRLMVDIEVSARALLAMRLAPITNAPPQTIHRLAFDDAIEVAGPVLSHSERLDDKALVENAKTKSQAHLLAIAQRRELSETVTEILVERGDQQILLSTARNGGARFFERTFDKLAEQSSDDELLVIAVGTRPDVPLRVFRQLLRRASERVRERLEASHPDRVTMVREIVAEVADRIELDHLGSGSSEVDIGPLKGLPESDEHSLAEAVRKGELSELAIILARVCEMPVVFVENALKQRRSQAILLLASANDFSWPVVRSILALRARLGFMLRRDVEQSRASYERISPASARTILSVYRN